MNLMDEILAIAKAGALRQLRYQQGVASVDRYVDMLTTAPVKIAPSQQVALAGGLDMNRRAVQAIEDSIDQANRRTVRIAHG